MIMFISGLSVGFLLSSLAMFILATRLQRNHDDTEQWLRQSRDSLSDALKERNDKLFEMEKELKHATEIHQELSGALQQLRKEHEKVLSASVEMSKEVVELRNLRGAAVRV